MRGQITGILSTAPRTFSNGNFIDGVFPTPAIMLWFGYNFPFSLITTKITLTDCILICFILATGN